MLEIDNQPHNMKTKLLWSLTNPGINQTTYSQPVIRPPKAPRFSYRKNHRTDTGTDPNLDFEENSPHQEGIIMETYVSPEQSYIENPKS